MVSSEGKALDAVFETSDESNYMKFVVKADADARYDVVKKVVQVFRDAKIKEFQMITGLEKSPQD